MNERTIGNFGIFDIQEHTWVLNCFDDSRDFQTREEAQQYKNDCKDYRSARYEVRLMANPARIVDWIEGLSSDKRTCRLFGFFCYADFDITPELLAPIVGVILDNLARSEIVWDLGRCETLNIGIYDGGRDIRCWVINPV